MMKKNANIFFTNVFRRLGLLSSTNYNWEKKDQDDQEITFKAVDWITNKTIYEIDIFLDHELKNESTDTYVFLYNGQGKRVFRMMFLDRFPKDVVVMVKKIMETPDLWVGKGQKVIK